MVVSNHRRSTTSVRACFLRDTIHEVHALPPGDPLRFTMAEIIAILPNLYKDHWFASRFLNNNITTAVHFAILDAHRELGLADDNAEMQAREVITEGYRKTMRAQDPEWRKASHSPPERWDTDYILVNDFVPAEVGKRGYRAPAPIPFKSLAKGLKKLPQGADAGDLTRALEYAIGKEKEEGVWMYPDDIHRILRKCGRTLATVGHTDRRVVRRWTEVLVVKKYQPPPSAARAIAPRERTPQAEAIAQQASNVPQQTSTATQKASTIPQQAAMAVQQTPMMSAGLSTPAVQQRRYDGFVPADHSSALPATQIIHRSSQTQGRAGNYTNAENTIFQSVAPSLAYEVGQFFSFPLQVEQQTLPPFGNYIGNSGAGFAHVDGLPRPYIPQPQLFLPNTGLLRDIPDWVLDDSDFSRAVRFAKQPDQATLDWHVDEAQVLSELLKFDGNFEDYSWLDLDAGI